VKPRHLTTCVEIERGDTLLDIDVEYTATPFVSATYWQPAEGGEVEIVAVTHGGAPFDLTDAEEDMVYTLCERHYVEHQGDDATDYAEYRYDQMRDEQMVSAWEAGR
jgi:hypothetical protein